MRNENPCRNCRTRRRKCVWEKGEPSCERCVQNGTKCIPCPTKEAAKGVRDGNAQLAQWYQEVLELEEVLDSAHNMLWDTTSTDATTVPIASTVSTLVPTTTTALPMTTNHPTKQNKNNEPQWTLSVVNGKVQLESNIKDYEELVMYQQASIRYLSPLAGLLERESVRFEGISISAIASANLVIQCSPYKPRPITIQQLPYTDIDYRHEMNQLITLYMRLYNSTVGVLHERSFMTYYNQLEDPLSSALVLATCIDAIAYMYPGLPYSSLEKRQWAEFFYSRYRDLLFDMYHDPNRRLEVVMTTSLVVQYLQDVVMEYGEARRMTTLALLICADLETHEIQHMSRVESVMFYRHRMYLQLCDRVLNVYLEGKFDFSGIQLCSTTDLLQDESQEVEQYLTTWKFILELLGCPYMTTLMEQINLTIYGESCEISLDMILGFETALGKWWKSLPDYFRVCEDPFTPMTQHSLEHVTCSVTLMPFATLHCLSAVVQSAMLNPSFDNMSDNAVASNMARIIHDKAELLTLTSIKVLTYVLKRNLEIDRDAIPLSIGYMMSTLQAVCSIISHRTDIQIQPEVLEVLSKCIAKLNTVFPPDHRQSPSSSTISPLEAFMKTNNTSPLFSPGSSMDSDDPKLMDIYYGFPLPGYSMTNDMLSICFNQLERKFRLAF